MDIFNVLSLIGGLCLFLFGMTVMGDALEKTAGNKIHSVLDKLTGRKMTGLMTGLGITAVIQSSSATTVMVVGFVNSGLMTLKQSINVIMGANIGTTVTAWILSLAGVESDNVYVKLLKPSSFTPVLALIGIILLMFSKRERKHDIGTIFLGFATLMFGMEAMSSAVSGLEDVPAFQQLFIKFTNPILGVLAGAILTAIIQSSSASVGILQALASTGQVSYGAAIPIIMGQNIGTCITAILSSIGANKNAKRAALVHLSFNVLGTIVWLTVFYIVKIVFSPVLLTKSASLVGIAIAHSAFNILCTIIMLPLDGFLEKLVCKLIPDGKEAQEEIELDERLLTTPAIALEQCKNLISDMSYCSLESLSDSISLFDKYDKKKAENIKELENKTDHYEDILGTYLVKLSSENINNEDSALAAAYLKMIGDFERIADHSVNILESAEEMYDKKVSFSPSAAREFYAITSAVKDVTNLACEAFTQGSVQIALSIEPLEDVIDDLRDSLRTKHIERLQQGECSIDTGFIWSDLLTNLERIGDHCSNIAGCIIDLSSNNMNIHETVRNLRKGNDEYDKMYNDYSNKYNIT